MPPLQLMRQMFANNFVYIIYFQQPGIAEAELNADVRKMMHYFLYGASGDSTPGTSNGSTVCLACSPKPGATMRGSWRCPGPIALRARSTSPNPTFVRDRPPRPRLTQADPFFMRMGAAQRHDEFL